MELTTETVAVYLRRVFAGYERALDRFDDASVNRAPHGDGTNSAAVLVTHACAAARFWLTHVALGDATNRVRDDEFVATATVGELRELVRSTCDDLVAASARLGGDTADHPERHRLYEGDASDGSVLLHVFEELFQHLGHLDLTADALAGPA